MSSKNIHLYAVDNIYFLITYIFSGGNLEFDIRGVYKNSTHPKIQKCIKYKY